MLRNQARIFRINPNITVQRVIVTKIGPVCFLCVLVPLGRKYAMSANALKSDPQPPYPRKQIDKPEADTVIAVVRDLRRRKLRDWQLNTY